jgi:hypothetical protein
MISFRPKLIFLVVISAGGAYAQQTPLIVEASTGRPSEFNGDVRLLPQVQSFGVAKRMLDEPEVPKPTRPDLTALQASENIPLAPMPNPNRNFAGLSFSDTITGGQAGAGWPPDINGDVGRNHYIEAVNDSYAIYNKSGVLQSAFTENSLFASGIAPCNGHSEGDPVVVYDQLNDRWILSHFAFTVSGNNPIAPFYQCIAVSKTSDPVAGGWWLYSFRMDAISGVTPAGYFNDYAKFGIWNDGCLYMGTNEFNMNSGAAFSGVLFASFPVAAMESGAAANFAVGLLTTAVSMFPSNLLGTQPGSMPPLGTPNYFVSASQSLHAFEVWKFVSGTACGATGASFTGPTNVSVTGYTTPAGEVVPQPNTGTLLDSLGDRVMQKVQYRRIGDAESLWVTHSVRTSASSNTAPQWAQINVSGGTIVPTPLQQQIYQPDSTLYRWMPSLAADHMGNMAVGYSTSNASTPNFPSIAYSGRLVGDTLNQLPQSEVQMQAGLGSQTLVLSGNPVQRWGDYSAMSVDPSDDCTFWYTNEYYDTQTNGTAGNWHTRIGSFKFPSCSSGLRFHPLPPCRVFDSRGATGPLGGPFLAAGATRSIPMRSSACGIPATAVAYAVNTTVVPRAGFLGYLTVWPTGQPQPNVSTLNSLDGSILANAAIVPAGTAGSINAFALNDTDLVLDINGYFSPPGASGELQFYPLTPCRVLDTRNAAGPFGGPALVANVARSFILPSAGCSAPVTAAAYSLNVTAVPHGGLGYLTAWPTGSAQPATSTLNSLDGTVLANAAIVPAGTAGAVSFFAPNLTDLVVDINGYFAPPGAGGLNFYPVIPCRVLDTRNANGTFGGPIISGNTHRDFALPQASCGLPSDSAAYSLNMTVVPTGSLGFATAWPAGLAQPLASTLNDPKGLALANALLVPAGTNGGISLYMLTNSHAIIDANGYFK